VTDVISNLVPSTTRPPLRDAIPQFMPPEPLREVLWHDGLRWPPNSGGLKGGAKGDSLFNKESLSMKRTLSMISATLLTGALATLAFAQAPAAPTADTPPTMQQEVVGHHHKAIMAHHREAMLLHNREVIAHHKAMMEKEAAMHEKRAAPGDHPASAEAPSANPPAPAN